QTPEVRRMPRIARDLVPLLRRALRQHAAPHTAVRTSRSNRRHLWLLLSGVLHLADRQLASWPVGRFHFTNAAPNSSLSRSGPISRPCVISSKYHGPSLTSPYSTAPRTLFFSMTMRL